MSVVFFPIPSFVYFFMEPWQTSRTRGPVLLYNRFTDFMITIWSSQTPKVPTRSDVLSNKTLMTRIPGGTVEVTSEIGSEFLTGDELRNKKETKGVICYNYYCTGTGRK